MLWDLALQLLPIPQHADYNLSILYVTRGMDEDDQLAIELDNTLWVSIHIHRSIAQETD